MDAFFLSRAGWEKIFVQLRRRRENNVGPFIVNLISPIYEVICRSSGRNKLFVEINF